MSKFINYKELQKIVQESKVGVRVKVQSNPRGRGGEQELTFIKDKDGNLTTYCNCQADIDGVDYAWSFQWFGNYKGTFGLVPETPVKPEVYAVGDWVVVTEEFKKCGSFRNQSNKENALIGQIQKITEVWDNREGVHYGLYIGGLFPHYAVQRVESPEPETIKINGKTYNKSEYDLAISNLNEIKI